MKLKDEFIKLPKDMVYDMYSSIVYDIKDYDDISRSKMLDDIVKEYKQKDYLYSICTKRELDFLKYISNHEITVDDMNKYHWEIRELNNKGIFSRVTLEVFLEQQENVKDALELYKKGRSEFMDNLIPFMIGFVKSNGEILTKLLVSIVSSLFKIKEEDVNKILGNPLFHFYCDFDYIELGPVGKQEIVFYRSYFDILDDLSMARKKYGMAGSRPIRPDDYVDIFYYGFPIRNKKVKLMYDEINKRIDKETLFKIVDEANVLNDRYGLDLFVSDDLLEIINEGLDESPSAAMNGFTPNEYLEQQKKKMKLDFKLNKVPQNNAHLPKKGADLYYKLYFGLLDYTNKQYKLVPELKKIYKQEGLNSQLLIPIDKYLWEHKEIIDEFIGKNEYKFTLEELEIIKGFKTSVTSDRFIVVGFEREYTEILSEDGKIYMVKGIRTDLDKLIDADSLPKVITTTLLMFNGNIVFNSFFTEMTVVFGNDIKEAIIADYEKAIRYYHL